MKEALRILAEVFEEDGDRAGRFPTASNPAVEVKLVKRDLLSPRT
jgi:hypothetical protein